MGKSSSQTGFTAVFLILVILTVFGLLLFVGSKVLKQNPVGASGTPLKTLAAARNLYIGAAVRDSNLTSQGCSLEPLYCDTLSREYNMIAPENAMKFSVLHPQQGVYDFSRADAIVSFAQAHNIKVGGHALVWSQQVPAWVTNGGFTPQQLSDILQDHILTVVTHFRDNYPGVVTDWDVVNEGFDLGIWGQIGTLEEVSALAFGWARQADPTVKLYYNDFNAEDDSSTKSNWVYDFVTTLKANGHPIDGVGMQAHLTLNAPSTAAMQSNLTRYANAGLEVKFTELDVRLPDNSSASLSAQAEIYNRVMTACVNVSACKGLLTWGFTDKYSWIPSFFPGFGWALPFDDNYIEKPAYTALQNALIIPDTTGPTVSITNPVNNGTVKVKTTVNISASATDLSGVSKVEFSVNGAIKCTDTTSPYNCNWIVPNTPKIVYTIIAKAFDTKGNITSTSVKVTSIK